MAALILFCGGLSVAVALRLPPTFLSSAKLLVEAPQIPEGMAASTVQTDPAEQLQVIEQRLLTRANLIDIANRHDVYEDSAEIEPDAVVTRMRQDTRIFRSSGRNQATLMTIRFSARTGEVAAGVVNDYVTRVLETNSNFRREQVEGTVDFFEQELNRLSADLDRQSARIAAFRSDNANALPEDQSYRLSRQTLLQERLARLDRERAIAMEQRRQIVAVFEATGDVSPGARRPTQPQLSPEQQRLETLNLELNELLSIYTETNPRVVALRARIAQLEDRILASEDAKAADVDADAEQEAEAIVEARNRENAALQITLSEIDTRVNSIEQEIEVTRNELSRLEADITASSANAIALDSLMREYANIETRYIRAADNFNQAQMSERIEVSSQGERISVIESANVPREPTGPNRPAMVMAGFGVGVGLAAAFFFLLEIVNRTIRRPSELESRFGVTPIATIPYLESARRRFLRRSALISASVVVIVGVPAGLWWIDTHYLPLQLLVEQGLDRLGLG